MAKVNFIMINRYQDSNQPTFEGWGRAASGLVHYFIPVGYIGSGNAGVEYRSICGKVWATEVGEPDVSAAICQSCKRSV